MAEKTDNTKITRDASIRKRSSTTLKTSKPEVKEGSAAEAAWWTSTSQKTDTPRGNAVMPAIQTKQYQTEDIENQSQKYPWLSLEEEAQIDANPQLSSITRERMYQEMYGKKQERAWLDDRANIRAQYISKQATTGSEEEDKAMINLSWTMDWVREEIIKAWWKWVNKVGDMELLNMISEANPYTAQIINQASRWDFEPEYATLFLLNPDVYKDTMADIAAQNPSANTSLNAWKKRKAWRLESAAEWAFSVVQWATKTIMNKAIDAATKYNPAMRVPAWIEYLITWEKPSMMKMGDIAKWAINEATWQWVENVNSDRKLRKWWYTAGKLTWEAWLATAASALSAVALSELWWTVWTALAGSKYAPAIEKFGWALEKIWQTWWGKVGKWLLWRIANGIEWWVTLQWVDDLVEWELSSAKDYMTSIEIATVLWLIWDTIWLWFKKFANPWKKIVEVTEGKWWLWGRQINQIENEVKMFNTTNKAENPFKIRASEVKTEAIPKLDANIKSVSKERDALINWWANDWWKATKDFVNELNNTLKNTDLGNIEVTVTKSGKLKVVWWSTAWSEAEAQLKEFVDMINAQSDWWTKSLVDTIKAAKQIAKEAQISWKSTKMTKAITDYSKALEDEVKKLYPDVWKQVSAKNSELSDLLGMKSKIIDLWDDYSQIAWKMNSDTDFYKFMDDLFEKWYTTEHFWNKTLWTYYTMWLRAPQLLSEQAKLFYPSVPWLEEAWLKWFMEQWRQAYWWLWAIAWDEVFTPIWAWSKMASDVWQLGAINNRR